MCNHIYICIYVCMLVGVSEILISSVCGYSCAVVGHQLAYGWLILHYKRWPLVRQPVSQSVTASIVDFAFDFDDNSRQSSSVAAVDLRYVSTLRMYMCVYVFAFSVIFIWLAARLTATWILCWLKQRFVLSSSFTFAIAFPYFICMSYSSCIQLYVCMCFCVFFLVLQCTFLFWLLLVFLGCLLIYWFLQLIVG